ncbi:SMC-Scp complex subunit ScpB [archaeon]|nr:SMC-Scp complex subunit ScpB [archaeon]
MEGGSKEQGTANLVDKNRYEHLEDCKKRIEAVLFTTGRFMDIEEIAKLCGIGSVGFVKEAIDDLKKEYEAKSLSLAIFEENCKFKLNIKKEFNYLTAKLLIHTEFDRSTQETLALIAYKQPILQSEIIKMRGNGAYEHIRLLREKEFVISEKSGRTRKLTLAQKFYEYFDVIEGFVKEQLKEAEEKSKAKEQEIENKMNETADVNEIREKQLHERVLAKPISRDKERKEKEKREMEYFDEKLNGIKARNGGLETEEVKDETAEKD